MHMHSKAVGYFDAAYPGRSGAAYDLALGFDGDGDVARKNPMHPAFHLQKQQVILGDGRMSTNSSGGACSKEVYTEEIPISPTTHLPGARFHLSGGLPPPAKNKGKGTVGDAYAELEGNDFVDAGGEVEIENEDEGEDEDSIDPMTPPPAPATKRGLGGKRRARARRWCRCRACTIRRGRVC
jgi:hypothetical protein